MSDTRDPGTTPDPAVNPGPERILSPGSEISPDTHVGTRFERVPPGVAAERSEARPEALIEGNRVARAEDME